MFLLLCITISHLLLSYSGLTSLNPQNGQLATFMLLQSITRQVLIIKYKSTTEKICKLKINKKVLSTENAY